MRHCQNTVGFYPFLELSTPKLARGSYMQKKPDTLKWCIVEMKCPSLMASLCGIHLFPRATKRVIFVPQHMISQVLEIVHSGQSGGHIGITRTLSRAKERFYWPHMKSSVQSYKIICKECIESKTSCTRRQAPLQPMVISEPFTFWAMDYMGPLPETARGNKHILVVLDHFTKWCEAFPMQDQKAQTVANILVSRLFSCFRPPQILHSDQGTNFESNLMKSKCDLMGIQKIRAIAYHPQGDGQIDRK